MPLQRVPRLGRRRGGGHRGENARLGHDERGASRAKRSAHGLLVLLGLALLYAYRAQAPAVSQIASTEAIAEVQSGQVRRVTIQGDVATLELRTGVKQQTRVAAQSDPLAKAILDYNAAHPGDQVELRYDSETTSFGPIGAVVLSLLPVVVIGAFFYFVMRRAASR